MNKKVFKTNDPKDGPEIELAAIRPSPKVQVQAQLEFNKNWAISERNGSILRRNLDDLAERHGLWNSALRIKVENIEEKMAVLERRLRSGAAGFESVVNAKEAALELRKLRLERLEILRARNSMDSYTAETFADGARLQYLVSQCIVYNEGNKAGQSYFLSYEDYSAKADDKVGRDALTAYLELIYGDIKEEEPYEITWLKKYNFVDAEGRLIDVKGRLVSDDGKLINDKYEYVTETGERCDRDGNRLSETGEYMIDYVEFEVTE